MSTEFPVKAIGPADATSLKQFKFVANEVVRCVFGRQILDLADTGNGYIAKNVLCDTLEILEVTEIETDDFD